MAGIDLDRKRPAMTILDGTPARTLRLDLEYDGSGFVGWQSQAEGRTVQQELQKALRRLLQQEVTPMGAGRTDAGTHAVAQVAHFHTNNGMALDRLLRGLNALLPEDLSATSVVSVPDDFHARFSAQGKRYRYRISPVRVPLDRHRVWTFFRPLDLQAMERAAEPLRGRLDFRAFCKALPPPDHFECHIEAAHWQQRGGELVFEVEANRFLRHMVRILVGTFVEVGLGKMTPEDFSKLLSADAVRSQGGQTAPACGLCLMYINYEESYGGRSASSCGQRLERLT
jgi:tRNA pseudouridine38-40 synthase